MNNKYTKTQNRFWPHQLYDVVVDAPIKLLKTVFTSLGNFDAELNATNDMIQSIQYSSIE